MRMKSVGEIGMKITSAQREYFRYTGASAELERRWLVAGWPGVGAASEARGRP